MSGLLNQIVESVSGELLSSSSKSLSSGKESNDIISEISNLFSGKKGQGGGGQGGGGQGSRCQQK